jgi:molybdopterin-guanine dinucleotide biosynthesis protein MobB
LRLRKDSQNTFFHSFEVTFSGFSNSGKTTLISKIIKNLSLQYDIGYFKHDAHKFVIDHENKDTWKMAQAGAKNIFINDPTHNAQINFQEIDQVAIRNNFIDSDFLIIEGHKYSELPKIVVISNKTESETLDQINNGKISNIIAIVTESKTDPLDEKFPHFQRDDISAIQMFLITRFKDLFPTTLNGLILTGGESQRMQEDKGSLIYHNDDQITHTTNLISPFCKEVFVSCKESQKELSFLKNHNLLFDRFPGGGPSIGILSAQNLNSNCSWLVIGCDLPYLDEETLKNLIENRNPFKLATCYLNPKRNWPEPICTIYEPKSYQKLMQYYSYNKPCPRKVLFNSNIEKLSLNNKMALENVNTPEQRKEAISYLTTHGENHAH